MTYTIQIDNHEQPCTVGEMWERLYRVLCNVPCDTKISFSFHSRLENYVASSASLQPTFVAGLFARPENE